MHFYFVYISKQTLFSAAILFIISIWIWQLVIFGVTEKHHRDRCDPLVSLLPLIVITLLLVVVHVTDFLVLNIPVQNNRSGAMQCLSLNFILFFILFLLSSQMWYLDIFYGLIEISFTLPEPSPESSRSDAVNFPRGPRKLVRRKLGPQHWGNSLTNVDIHLRFWFWKLQCE